MTSGSPFSPDRNRRDFVKKSLAASIIAAQPTILAGLVRAEGGGGGGTTVPETTVPWETTIGGPTSWDTTVETSDWGTTYETSTSETSVPETTEVETTSLIYDINSATANETGVGAISFHLSGFGHTGTGRAVPSLGPRAAITWKANIWSDSPRPSDPSNGHQQRHKFQVALEIRGNIDPRPNPSNPKPNDPPVVYIVNVTDRSEFLVVCEKSTGTIDLEVEMLPPNAPIEPSPEAKLLLDYFDVQDSERYAVTGHVKNWTWTGLGSSTVQAKCNLELEVKVGLTGTPSVVDSMELVFDISSHQHT